jgi:hypothetical protein
LKYNEQPNHQYQHRAASASKDALPVSTILSRQRYRRQRVSGKHLTVTQRFTVCCRDRGADEGMGHLRNTRKALCGLQSQRPDDGIVNTRVDVIDVIAYGF